MCPVLFLRRLRPLAGSWHPCCVGPVLASVLAFVVVLALASVLTYSAGVRRAGIRTGVRLAGVHVGIHRAGVRTGVRRAGVRAGVCLAVVRAFARVSVLLSLAFAWAFVLLSCWRLRGRPSCCHSRWHLSCVLVLCTCPAWLAPMPPLEQL